MADLSGVYPGEEANSFFSLLAQAFLGMSRLEVALQRGHEISAISLEKFEDARVRLMRHEPIQYILGETEFFGLKFKVNEDVLVPRPETEELVQWILDEISFEEKEIKILDIGTGSGCIAISLAKELSKAKVTAIDISENALEVARENARINKVEIAFLQQNILKLEELEGEYDLIVSNPPYVREQEKEEMQRNVLDFEPAGALYVKNTNPLIFYRKITKLAKKALIPGGKLFLEINQYLGPQTRGQLAGEGFSTELRKDIFGNFRMLKGIKV